MQLKRQRLQQLTIGGLTGVSDIRLARCDPEDDQRRKEWISVAAAIILLSFDLAQQTPGSDFHIDSGVNLYG
ncbi:hypothetical protein [Kineobactrum salinum]|uniref:Uncharacterized protein n=1 Tax=Kineobactrum salinum TaxID=2708301 RepID=A0A6C0U257_9GAMM|nr:hypothetical protein [Kineobactrum salinum]QIB65893.1 hypothetical protein G3T16_11160 [Kineobactrum salinum]